ncbi:unnamed protein product [Hymenolepis diminuta]|uniref:G_PROTEIN_RECEP_F1_2 domain-containing protein n=2 Tax=Hymenolepis diminuta TaxID=6216 RepID=A0A0R3SSS7_HYMDI|nr:unnamed protein product [Hymenolepis diminuta]
MLIAMVVVFVVCWIPLNAVSIYTDMRMEDPNYRPPYYSDVIFLTCHIIAMSSAVYNPLLYAWLSETFRRNLWSMIPRWNRKSIDVGGTITPNTPVMLGDTVLPTSNRGEINETSRRSMDLQTRSEIGVDRNSCIQLQEEKNNCDKS